MKHRECDYKHAKQQSKHQLQESDTNNEVKNTFQHLAMNDIYYLFIFSLLKRVYSLLNKKSYKRYKVPH